MIVMENQFMKQIFDGVTKSIASGRSLDDDITNQIQKLVMSEVSKQIPNAMPKASSQAIGTISDPETGWTYEALTGEIMNGASSFGVPISDGRTMARIKYPNTPEDEKLSAKVKAQDRDWQEDCFSPEYRGKYQESKDLKIKAMTNSYNPYQQAMVTGLPYNVVVRSNPLAAALITSKDYATLQVNNNLIATLGLGQRTRNEANGFVKESAPNLVAKYWKFDNSSLKIEKGVPEGKIISETKSEIVEVKYQIGKNAGAVGATWESSLMVTQGDPYGMISGRIGNLLSNARAEMLIDEMEANAVAAVGGADMGDMTGDRNTNDPTDFLQPVIDAMRKKTDTFDDPIGNVSIFTSSKAFTKFLNSTFTKGWFQPNGRMVLSGEQSSAGAFLPIGSNWFTTDLIVSTLMYVIDPRSIPAFLGPTQRSEWFDGRNLSRATYYFDAFGTHIVAPELTAVFSDVVTL
jgi:hypothetical protein